MGLTIGQEPVEVAPGRYDDPILQHAPRQGLYKDDDEESINRFVKSVRHSCDAYVDQCRAAEKEICDWYGFPKEDNTCTGAISEHLRGCDRSSDTWRDLKKEARMDVYKEINAEYGPRGVHLPTSSSFLLQRGEGGLSKKWGMRRGKRKLLRGKKKGKIQYSPRSKKHFNRLCEECRAAQTLPRDDPGHAKYSDVRGICKCAQEFGFVAGMHEKAEDMGCAADE